MAGWLSAVHGSSDDEKMVIYEEAASALAKEIEARGGWRAACTLQNGGINESVDIAPWPDRDALQICKLLKNHFQHKYNAAEASRLRRAPELRRGWHALAPLPSALEVKCAWGVG